MKKKKFNRSGRQADIAQLTLHGWFGDLIDRIKAKTTEKEKGIMMLDKIENQFNISQMDREAFRKVMKEREKEDFEEMKEQARERRKGDPFTRDEKGNIVSPFRSKEKIRW
ncbi:hypothetical protein LCGC14_0937120 [marine sediment metagenome]|uniref:Uncharacterized protein n=1 Tax=marine sediment metagenome TaxID=412755 RepID=A0A0F9NLE1_9ZZZZ